MTDTNDPGNGFGNDFGNFSGDRGWGDSSGGYATAGDHNARTGYPDYSGYPATGIGTGTGNGTGRDAGFFSALFDFSFRKYATPSIVKIVYILVTVVMVLGALVWTITGAAGVFDVDPGLGVLFLLLGVPFILVALVLQLALFRVLLEASLALIRSAQSLQNLEQRR
ncbi:DUF4282 domain-containing protein [Corynebacterium xerosis]|uniref:DUF4282 domain-containing protein n=1 Tax=Corynebacterium xerosis TaxID=1725 RepID=UPI00364EEC99